MQYSEIIEKIMPLVKESDKTTLFAVSRQNGEWTVKYPNSSENAANFLAEIHKTDPFAVMFTGADFAKGSFPFVYDKILCARIYEEYRAEQRENGDSAELYSMACFFEDNISEFSQKLTDYLTEIDRPLAALAEMCPYDMSANCYDLEYDENSAFDAIHFMENEVNDRLHSYPDDSLPEPRYIHGYEEKQIVQIGKITVILAENLKAGEPYLVCSRDGDEYNFSKFPDYIPAVREFLTRQSELIGEFEAEREARKQHGVGSAVLTSAHCLPDKKADFTGKLLVVKASELLPVYRYADFQIILCSHGNGCRSDSIGTSVFGKELYSGDSVCYGRFQIEGVAVVERLPKWSQEKFAELNGSKERHISIDDTRESPAVSKHTPQTKKQKPSLLKAVDESKKQIAATDAERKKSSKSKKHENEI